MEANTNCKPERLKRRSDFLAMRGGVRHHADCFVLQARRRGDDEVPGAKARFGFTITKKNGNAVERNRIRRRLREAVARAAPGHAHPGFDYVLLGRRRALGEKFETIVSQLAEGLDRTARLGANPRQRKERPAHGSAAGAANHHIRTGPAGD